jgi:Icc-related predicted phosphoesterase
MPAQTVPCYFVSDLHGRLDRYEKLFLAIRAAPPRLLFIGGDLLPSGMASLARNVEYTPFVDSYLAPAFRLLRSDLRQKFPSTFVILGNDDGKFEEDAIIAGDAEGLWHYVHNRWVDIMGYSIFGYNFVPPSPFQLKDWERYDVSRYVDPGCVSPEEGSNSRSRDHETARYSTIERDLRTLSAGRDLSRSVALFHTPPYNTDLDWVDHHGRMIEGIEPDPHIGSIAVRRFIETKQPWLTLHGHAHESVRISDNWLVHLGNTVALGAAHDGPELSVISFDLADPSAAVRKLL